MIASRALVEKNKKTLKMIKKIGELYAIQIAGCDPILWVKRQNFVKTLVLI